MKIYNNKKFIAAVALSLVLASCKAPMATVIKDEVKEKGKQNLSYLLIILWSEETKRLRCK